MPVVNGQPIVALCLVARAERISLIVAIFPFGTFRINWSTSIGNLDYYCTCAPFFAHFTLDFFNFRIPFAVV